uniref:Putative reverse transcriptase, RNA-dependent DNA polymerase, Gag-polypeptide of LTR copia-type n=1 Tax=Tanacetum cinerariifolium TaxID=118510 RepID=A0A6L2LR77_TANCI|nr:putative reverse transcriptase, RNA-dependent DNA polymerase, Gag-polypeptide of LTR copia-type [Tanacetum cinerariifolium]
MFNVIDVSNLNLTVGHLNGTLAKITVVGNLRLTPNVVLFDVLEYCVSLLSIHKSIKDSKLFVGINEHTCYVQDLNLVKTVGTSNDSGGLYLFDVEQCGKYNVGLSNFDFVCHVPKQLWHGRLDHPSDQVLLFLTVRRSDRVRNLLFKFNDFVLPSDKKYGIEKHVSYSNLSTMNFCFATNLYKSTKLKTYLKDFQDQNWVEVMNSELEALFGNNTWILTDLHVNRKTIGCKWLFKIKYKSSDEIERYKARLIAKDYSQRKGIDYEETFSPVVKMHMHSPLQTHFNVGLRVLRYLKMNLGNLISWKNKKQATLSMSLAEAEYRCMASITCKVVWLINLLKDLNVEDLLPVYLYCDSNYAI